MQVKRTNLSENKTKLTISAEEAHLAPIKQKTLQKLAATVKVQGFREGKVPLNLVEKNVDPQALQSEFMEDAINHFYAQAMQQEDLRPIDRPKVNIIKFVPFTTLEFEAEVEILGTVKLPDYKKIKLTKTTVKITDKDINEVLKTLQTRLSEKKEVARTSKNGDEVLIDFTGTNEKDEPIKGAEGKEYPLVLGSKSFIPGFEENVIGLKAKDEKTFKITFPKDYGVAALANKKVTFAITVHKVQELVEPKLDDAFAAKAGPFKTLKDLKADIKKELTTERQRQSDNDYQNELVGKIAEKTKLSLPQVLVGEQLERLINEAKQNATYRGQTYPEFLEMQGLTEEQHREKLKPEAEKRVRIGLTLAEVASEEKVTVTPDELEIRMQQLKVQYQDPQMQAELEKPQTRQDIASQMITEKTVGKLMDYAAQ